MLLVASGHHPNKPLLPGRSEPVDLAEERGRQLVLPSPEKLGDFFFELLFRGFMIDCAHGELVQGGGVLVDVGGVGDLAQLRRLAWTWVVNEVGMLRWMGQSLPVCLQHFLPHASAQHLVRSSKGEQLLLIPVAEGVELLGAAWLHPQSQQVLPSDEGVTLVLDRHELEAVVGIVDYVGRDPLGELPHPPQYVFPGGLGVTAAYHDPPEVVGVFLYADVDHSASVVEEARHCLEEDVLQMPWKGKWVVLVFKHFRLWLFDQFVEVEESATAQR